MKHGFYQRLEYQYQHTRAITYATWFHQIPPNKRPPINKYMPLPSDKLELTDKEKVEIDAAVQRSFEASRRKYEDIDKKQRDIMRGNSN